MNYFIAVFKPQRWQGDCAIDAEPRGPNEWDVSAFLATLPTEQRQAVLSNHRGAADILANDPAAPEWIRAWQDPFEISVREQTTPLEASTLHYQVLLDVKVRAATTRLSAIEHANAVREALRHAIGGGLLSTHDSGTEIDEYHLTVQVPQ